MKSYTFSLLRPARKQGGDLYQVVLDEGVWKMYVPQSISRDSGEPHKQLRITIEE